jgi:hypothetical protein
MDWQLPSGLRPFARLRSVTECVYSKKAEFLAGIVTSCHDRAGPGEQPRKRRHWRRAHVDVKPLQRFHAAPAYAGDLHRADMAWARHAAGGGLTLERIKDQLFHGGDLSKKGSRQRQLEYAERTARKAIGQFA